MRARAFVVAVLVLATSAAAAADRWQDDAEVALAQLRADDRVQQVYGALTVHRLARERWGLTLRDAPVMQRWQTALVPHAQALVPLLADQEPMQWVDATSDKPVIDHATTPRREAARALLALERGAIAPLIDAVGGQVAPRRADELLREIVGSGPAEPTMAAWQAWWREHQREPLRNERGRWVVALGVTIAAIAGAVLIALWLRAGQSKRRFPSLKSAG